MDIKNKMKCPSCGNEMMKAEKIGHIDNRIRKQKMRSKP